MHKSAFRRCVLENLIGLRLVSPGCEFCTSWRMCKNCSINSSFQKGSRKKKKKQPCSHISALIDGVAMGTREKLGIRSAAWSSSWGMGESRRNICRAGHQELKGKIIIPWDLPKCCILLPSGREWVCTLVTCLWSEN